jgi:hypothetical protein
VWAAVNCEKLKEARGDVDDDDVGGREEDAKTPPPPPLFVQQSTPFTCHPFPGDEKSFPRPQHNLRELTSLKKNAVSQAHTINILCTAYIVRVTLDFFSGGCA